MNRIYPQPPPQPRLLSTTDGKPCILDPRSYGGIVDRVISHADHRTRIALWGTCAALYRAVSAHFYRHVVLSMDLRMADGTLFPFKFKVDYQQESECGSCVARYTRVFDLVSPINSRLAIVLLQLLRTVRTFRTRATLNYDMFPPIPGPNIVLTSNCMPPGRKGWQHPFILVSDGIPAVPRVVINVAYNWPQQLVASHFSVPEHMSTVPEGVNEIVFHFQKFGERARYLLLYDQPIFYPGAAGYNLTFDVELRGTFTSASTPPVLQPNEYIELVDKMPVRTGLFNEIAELYASAIGHGKRGTRSLRLTMVGLEEFDAARDADAADDTAFARIVDSLPWADGEVPGPDMYAHDPYEPIAPAFVNLITDLVHHTKHERVRRNVKLLSSAEYLASLEHPADEDWWHTESDSKCTCCNTEQCLWELGMQL
jgi:hypothetical protein